MPQGVIAVVQSPVPLGDAYQVAADALAGTARASARPKTASQDRVDVTMAAHYRLTAQRNQGRYRPGEVNEPPLPDGLRVGHRTAPAGGTGCTVVICPPGTRGAVEVRGGGTGTRELEPLAPLANAEGPNAVLLTGGSAFGLAAADGAVRWLEERGIGRPTPFGVVPLVPTAVVFDPSAALADTRPGPEDGYLACEAARPGVPERGRIGAGAGTAVGKLLGREHGTPSGVGYAARQLGGGVTVAALVVANAFGDVLDEDGSVLGGPRDGLRSADLVEELAAPGDARAGEHTTLVCVCTDAPLDKRGCGIVARVASAGLARAVDPAFTPYDGDVVFCLASGAGAAPEPGVAATWMLTRIGTVAATVTAAAIRDAVRRARGHAIMSL
jgi:L-aminopeptidase/D-esterase-like protein